MTIIIILLGIIASCYGFYLLISSEIEQQNAEIMNKLEWIDKQNNMLQEDVNELRLQVNDVWREIQTIVNDKN